MKSRFARRLSRFLGSISSTFSGLSVLGSARVLLGVFLTVSILFVAFVFSSSYFTIKKITPSRTNPHLDIIAVQKSLEGYYGKNIIFLSIEDIKTRLIKDFPAFESVEISAQWPDELLVNPQMSESVIIVENDVTKKFSVLSKSGVVLPVPADDSLPKLILKQRESFVDNQEELIQAQYMADIMAIPSFFEEHIETKVVRMEYLEKAEELHLFTPSGTKIMLDMRQNMENQLRLLTYNTGQFMLERDAIEHIDLRIPGAIYWKEATL